jgi:hypothetical protein
MPLSLRSPKVFLDRAGTHLDTYRPLPQEGQPGSSLCRRGFDGSSVEIRIRSNTACSALGQPRIEPCGGSGSLRTKPRGRTAWLLSRPLVRCSVCCVAGGVPSTSSGTPGQLFTGLAGYLLGFYDTQPARPFSPPYAHAADNTIRPGPNGSERRGTRPGLYGGHNLHRRKVESPVPMHWGRKGE